MENTNLFLIRLILACILFTIVLSGKPRDKRLISRHKMHTKPQSKITTELQTETVDSTKPDHKNIHVLPQNNERKGKKHSKKSKRDAYGYRQAGERSTNFGYGGYHSNLPLYLVYNRKVGAYYPYYKYPKENSLRRRNSWAFLFKLVPLDFGVSPEFKVELNEIYVTYG